MAPTAKTTPAPAMTSSIGKSRSKLQAPGSRQKQQPLAANLQPSASAMTLIELLVVLGVVGLIVGMSIPAMAGYAKQLRLKATTRQLVGLISLARSVAIGSHESHAVVIDAEQREVRVVNQKTGEALEQIVRLPSSVTVELQVGGDVSSETQFVFRPTGALQGRTVSLVLSDRDRQHIITVTGTTGSVSVQ